MIAGLATFVLVCTPSVPPILKGIGINPYLAIVNIMACRVFRRTRAGLIRETQTSTSVIVEEIIQPHRMTLSGSGEDATSVRNAATPFSG